MELRVEGMNVLMQHMGILDAERFISIIQTDKFDYTKWQQKNLWTNLSVREISKLAMENKKRKKN